MAFLKGLNVDALKGTIEAGVKAAREGVANLNVEGVVQGAKDAVAAGATMVGDSVESVVRKEAEDQEGTTLKDFIALLWCLAYIDGGISDDEKATLHQLSGELDACYESYASEVEEMYLAKLQDTSSEFGQQNAAKIEARRIVESIGPSAQDARLLCWNLLALANSDGLDEREIDFIRFVCEKAGLEAAVFAEMQNYSDAIVEIERAIEQLKTSGKPYGEIEPLVGELAGRQQVILEAIRALVTDR